MKIHFDEKADAIFIRLNEDKKIKEFQEMAKGVIGLDSTK